MSDFDFASFQLCELLYEQDSSTELVNFDDVIEGVSQDVNYFYHRTGERIIVYDRICDHGGGKMALSNGLGTCPLHGWRLELSNGSYINANCFKKPIIEVDLSELDSPIFELPKSKATLLMESWVEDQRVEIKFLNHACLIVKSEALTFATDPWLMGSAFSNGWWLSERTPVNAFEEINGCDFIYISHNHPDHLHLQSLRNIRKDMPILTAGFASESTVLILKHIGFNNITAMDFSSAYVDSNRRILFSVLKSGDFRDDSGLLFQCGSFRALLTVDSNFLNFGKLPQVDFLASSFAGGASGFPLCFENYSPAEKAKVVDRNKSALIATNSQNIKNTGAKYFMPYAGFFKEAASRDSVIRKQNKKNAIADFAPVCRRFGANLLNVLENQVFVFDGKDLVETAPHTGPLMKLADADREILEEKGFDLVDDEIEEIVVAYFEGSAYKDDLLVELIMTDDDFSASLQRFSLDFKVSVFKAMSADDPELLLQARSKEARYLRLKVRRAELLKVLLNGQPWEDLSIGFQCRIFREPNVYNSSFWYHFTNNYIGKRVPWSVRQHSRDLFHLM